MANQKFRKLNTRPLREEKDRPAEDSRAENFRAEQDVNADRPVRKKKKRVDPAKRRKMADMKASAIAFLLFAAFVILVALFLLVVPRSKISNIEKRALAEFPVFTFADYFAGDFTSGVATFYDDTVPARDSFKNAGNNIKSMFGIKATDQAEFIGVASKKEEVTTAPAETAAEGEAAEAETTTAEPETEEDINSRDYAQEVADATMEDGILVVYQDDHWRAIVLCGDVDGTLYAEEVNKVCDAVGKDVNLYFMPIPVSCQYYVPGNYSEYAFDATDTFQRIADDMDKQVTYVPIIEALNNHNLEPIFLRTDHHWAPLGAYYAAREFTKAANVPFMSDLEKEYEKVTMEGYVGSMYAFTGSANILNDPEDFVYYKGNNSYIVDYYDEYFNYSWTGDLFFDFDVSSAYLSFLGTDDQIAKITTDVKNGRKMLMVKDSYGNAMVPFLTGSFEEIYIVDQRYFQLNLVNFINTQGITDVLFSNNIFCLTGAEAELLQGIVEWYGDTPIVDSAPPAELPKKGNSSSKDSSSSGNSAGNSSDSSSSGNSTGDSSDSSSSGSSAGDSSDEEATE